MGVSYNIFMESFLDKITEFDFLQIGEIDSEEKIDRYMKRAIVTFKKNCKYDLTSTANDKDREFTIDIKKEDLDEIVDIISEGMIVEWLKPFVYNQENLKNVLNTRDFITYSPSELLLRIGDAYNNARKGFVSDIREYSYNHGDLSSLHL